jgi:hypothetical protein
LQTHACTTQKETDLYMLHPVVPFSEILWCLPDEGSGHPRIVRILFRRDGPRLGGFVEDDDDGEVVSMDAVSESSDSVSSEEQLLVAAGDDSPELDEIYPIVTQSCRMLMSISLSNRSIQKMFMYWQQSVEEARSSSSC